MSTGRTSNQGEQQRRAGRPRLTAGPVSDDPVDDILAAAGTLFGERGVGGTTMSRIADTVGLRQSSLYYYFRRKEEIVAALVDRANVIPLELIARVATEGGPVPVQLYRFVRGDVIALCGLPFDINEIHRVAARDRDEFAGYWRERSLLERRLTKLLRSGIDDGSLRDVDPRLTALTVMANDEGVQNWYRLAPEDPQRVGAAVAELTVAGLVRGRTTLETIRTRADRMDALPS